MIAFLFRILRLKCGLHFESSANTTCKTKIIVNVKVPVCEKKSKLFPPMSVNSIGWSFLVTLRPFCTQILNFGGADTFFIHFSESNFQFFGIYDGFLIPYFMTEVFDHDGLHFGSPANVICKTKITMSGKVLIRVKNQNSSHPQ